MRDLLQTDFSIDWASAFQVCARQMAKSMSALAWLLNEALVELELRVLSAAQPFKPNHFRGDQFSPSTR